MASTGYIMGINQRNAVDNVYAISIRYYENGVAKSFDVPITPRATRRFMLMQEDFVLLEFSLEEAVNFGIGSYIIDPIFGKFYVTEEQMPKFNQTTCGYDYSLRFDKDYLRWRNYLNCLVSNNKRMETSWSLTDKLVVHAQQISDNVNVVFVPSVTPHYDTSSGTTVYESSGYAVSVDNGLSTANAIKFISYDGVDIITAMNMIADAYECEWWVTDDKITIGNTTYDHTIHFGKCELDNNRFSLVVGDNVESIEATRDQQSFANRLFAYGGTQNIPENYDRRLLFKADNVTYSGRYIASVKDSQRELTLAMIAGEGSVAPSVFSFGSATQGGSNMNRTYTLASDRKSLSGEQTIEATLLSSFTLMSDDWAGTDIPQVSVTAFLYYGSELKKMQVSLDEDQFITDGKTWYAEISLDHTISIGNTAKNVYVEVVWTVVFGYQSEHLDDEVDCGISGTLTATADASTATKDVVVHYNNVDYPATFSGATGRITFGDSKPASSFLNKNFTISPLNVLKIPLGWYTIDYDTGTMRMAGEKRLHLPLDAYPNRYVDCSNSHSSNLPPSTLDLEDASQIVESAVVFNDVFPRLTLRIKQGSLLSTPMKQKIEHSDGSVTWEDWTQYSFKAEYYDNGSWQDFPFKLDYMLDGAKLQVAFMAPETSQESGYMLAGMTFDVGFKQEWNGAVYTIVRNEDFGALLPNKILKPSEGDTFVLIGWNPVAIDALGLVDAAEQELADKAEEYLDAIQEGQFTFVVKMMSDVFYTYQYGGRGQGANGLQTFGLLALGARVSIEHDGLPGGTKNSRVIGFEYKLDYPQDTPIYTIGETDAYSRLKRLEKQLTKLS